MWNTDYWHLNYWHADYWAEEAFTPEPSTSSVFGAIASLLKDPLIPPITNPAG